MLDHRQEHVCGSHELLCVVVTSRCLLLQSFVTVQSNTRIYGRSKDILWWSFFSDTFVIQFLFVIHNYSGSQKHWVFTLDEIYVKEMHTHLQLEAILHSQSTCVLMQRPC